MEQSPFVAAPSPVMVTDAPMAGPPMTPGSGTLDLCHFENFAIAACLAGSAGIRATLPAFLISILHQLNPQDYPISSEVHWIARPEICLLLGLLLLVEILADMIPAVDHAVHAILAPVHPAMGALMAITPDYCGGVLTKAPMAFAGAFMALGVHGGKAVVRAGSSATTGTIANPCVSVVESVLSFMLVVISFAHPFVALVVVALLALIAVKGLQASMKILCGSEVGAVRTQQSWEGGYYGNNPHIGPGPTWAAAGPRCQGNGVWHQRQAQPYVSSGMAPDAKQAFRGLHDEEFQRLLQETLADETNEAGEGGNGMNWPLSTKQQASALRAEAAHEVERILATASGSEALGGGSAGEQKREFRRLVRLLHPDKGNVSGERASLALRRIVEANRTLEGDV